MPAIRLHDIVTAADREAVIGLRRAPGQDAYVSSMQESFEEADAEQRAMPRPWAVHDDATGALVGFAMISHNIPQPMDDDLVGPYFCGSCSSTSNSRAAATARPRSTQS